MPIKTKKFEDIIFKSIDYSAYFDQIRTEFNMLVTTQQTSGNKDEAAVQRFIEQNPIAITGLLSELPAGYNIMAGVIISQPMLKSYGGDRQPDFLIITGNSLELFFNFIELESPAKRLFRRANLKVTADFQDAVDQVFEWKTFADHHFKEYCQTIIHKIFRNQSNLTKAKTWHINHVLVYGDSKEIDDKNDDKYRLLLNAKMPGVKLVTYTRLMREMQPQFALLTIMFKAPSNQYEAIGMTPNRNYGLDEWLNYHLILNKQEVVDNDRFLSTAEKLELNSTITRLDKMTEKEVWADDSLTSTDFPGDIDKLNI